MTKITLSKHQAELLEKALRYMISNLQYERHQAREHGCNTAVYDAEIEEYRQFKKIIQDARTDKGSN